MADFSSIILRFRDLSTPAGTTTIREHQTIILRGHVWWGWWKKQGERVPEFAFRHMLRFVKPPQRYEVFLFDTGKNELRRAYITDIKWDTGLEPIPTPELHMTPAYYGQAHYCAWFKITQIDDDPLEETELHKWSYVRVDDLFETGKSIFDAFYDKQVRSFTELRNQERTMWFVRPTALTDRVHEIHVYDLSKITPSNFPQQIVQMHSPNLLWVSDPHFSYDYHDFPRKPEISRSNLFASITNDLERTGVHSVGGLILSGDLTWRASREEFDWARNFINDVMSWSKLTASHILVCPGNHDLSFSEQPWTKGTPAKAVGDVSVAEYRRFYEGLYEVKPTDEMACGRRFWVPDGGVVDVVALNSSVLQQVEDAFQGQGFLGRQQLEHAAHAMKWSRYANRPKAHRVCVLHHHVVPILHREHPEVGLAASVVYDAGALMRWLVENEVDLVLHGHMHLPALVKERRALDYPKQVKWHEITIAALGSSGVIASHRPNQANCYGLIQFTRSSIKIAARKISSDDSLHDDQRVVYEAELAYI